MAGLADSPIGGGVSILLLLFINNDWVFAFPLDIIWDHIYLNNIVR